MNEWLSAFAHADTALVNVFQGIMRYFAPAMLLCLLIRAVLPLLTFRREPEIWAWLCLPNDRKLPVTHWENVIGRAKRSDIVLDLATVSRTHAVLTRYDDGSWSIADAQSSSGVLVNGQKVEICALEPEDVISIGGLEMKLLPISRKQEIRLAQLRTKAAKPATGIVNLILLTAFQVLVTVSYLINSPAEYLGSIFWGFTGIIACQWLLMLFYILIRKPSFELEMLAFILCTMGMAVIAAVKPGETVKQLIAMLLGVMAYLAIGWSLRDLERAKMIRYLAAVAGIGLLMVTMLFGREYNGAKNWLILGPLSIQPSELSKVCFVFIGASTMDRIINKRNLILFIVYSIAVCGCLAVMNDFGTALIFFVAFLMIAFLRSGSIGTVALACTALGFAGVIALRIAPHALRRFAAWRHIWENPLTTGYQQTRSLMCLASGGLFGLGAGNGWMKNLFAADSDVVFCTVAEEWGILISILMVLCVIAMALFSLRTTSMSRSSFHIIGSCTAATILLVQAIFNALGTLDILPLTGVTFPFLSNGGSSMIGAWGLLAFIKAGDTRQNASFAVRQSKEGRRDYE